MPHFQAMHFHNRMQAGLTIQCSLEFPWFACVRFGQWCQSLAQAPASQPWKHRCFPTWGMHKVAHLLRSCLRNLAHMSIPEFEFDARSRKVWTCNGNAGLIRTGHLRTALGCFYGPCMDYHIHIYPHFSLSLSLSLIHKHGVGCAPEHVVYVYKAEWLVHIRFIISSIWYIHIYAICIHASYIIHQHIMDCPNKLELWDWQRQRYKYLRGGETKPVRSRKNK